MSDLSNIDFIELWKFCQSAEKQYSLLFYYDGKEINSIEVRYKYGDKINEYLKEYGVASHHYLRAAHVIIQLGLIPKA